MPLSSNITSPRMHICDDVLREIFIHLVCRLHEDFSLTSAPLTLYDHIRYIPQLSVSLVCSSWRHVALRTPQLWDNISIDSCSEATLRIARKYLARAENLPISISISLYPADLQSQIIDFLSSYRIRYANVLNIHHILPDLPQRSVADLEKLVLSHMLNRMFREGQIELNDTRYPKLAVVDIVPAGLGVNFGIHSVSISSRSLRIFRCRKEFCMTVIEGWNLLSRCPSLEECRLCIRQDWPVSDSVPQIQLQHLRILELIHIYKNRDECLFTIFTEALSLPVIENLCVSLDRVPWPMAAFQSLAHRSNYFPHLTDLTVRYPGSAIDMGALLALMPSLKTISARKIESLFDNLALNGLASGSLAPRLQSLEIGRVSNLGLFLDMVESRMKNAEASNYGVPASWKNVFIAAEYYDNGDRLRDMRERGIPIHTK